MNTINIRLKLLSDIKQAYSKGLCTLEEYLKAQRLYK